HDAPDTRSHRHPGWGAFPPPSRPTIPKPARRLRANFAPILCGAGSVRVRVGHLYPDYLNIYADRGNIAVLERRAAWRGHEFAVESISVGDALAPGAHDLLYVGGGQDREQAVVAAALAARADAVPAAGAGAGAR